MEGSSVLLAGAVLPPRTLGRCRVASGRTTGAGATLLGGHCRRKPGAATRPQPTSGALPQADGGPQRPPGRRRCCPRAHIDGAAPRPPQDGRRGDAAGWVLPTQAGCGNVTAAFPERSRRTAHGSSALQAGPVLPPRTPGQCCAASGREASVHCLPADRPCDCPLGVPQWTQSMRPSSELLLCHAGRSNVPLVPARLLAVIEMPARHAIPKEDQLCSECFRCCGSKPTREASATHNMSDQERSTAEVSEHAVPWLHALHCNWCEYLLSGHRYWYQDKGEQQCI